MDEILFNHNNYEKNLKHNLSEYITVLTKEIVNMG